MASADFTVNGNAVPPEIAVSAGSLVTLALLSVSGVDTVEWAIIGNHSPLAVNPAITRGGSPLGRTATFTMPSGSGQGYLIQCTVNGGVDSEGVAQAAYVKTALVGVLDGAGVVPFTFGETFERSATHGSIDALNTSRIVGSSGHLIEDEGIALTPRNSLNFVGVNVAVTDVGGKTVVTIGAVSLTAGVSGILPVANGGTGLGAGGTNGQILTMVSGVPAWATPGGGSLTAPTNPGDDGKVAIAAAGNFSYAFVANSHVASNAAIVLSKLADGSACSVVGRGANSSGAHADITAGTNGHVFLRRSNALIAALIEDENIASGAITPAKLSSLALTDIPPVDLATTGNITLSGEQTIDGTLTSANRVLVWKQSTASQNGFYVTGAGAWTRATDADATADFRPFVFFGIKGGTANGGKVACLLTSAAITVGSTSIAYAVAASSPVSGTDDNKVGVASSGQIVYQLLTWANHAAGAAKGNSPVWNGSAWGEFGVKTRATDLTDANATLAVSDGNRAVLPAGVLTANRQGQFSLTGATDKEIYTVERYDTGAFTYAIKNSAGVTLYTFPVSVRRMATFQFVGGEWTLSAHGAIN